MYESAKVAIAREFKVRLVNEMNIGLLVDSPKRGTSGLDPSIDGDSFAACHQLAGNPNGANMRLATCILIIALLGICQEASAFRLHLNGLVTDYATQQPMSAARVRIYKNGVMQRVARTGALGQYSIILDNHADYVVRVDAPGYQVKCITIDTQGLEWESDRRVSHLEVEMRLPTLQSGIDLSYFDLPLGMARFEPATGLTRWNMTYERIVNAAAQEVMARYDQRCMEMGMPVARGDMELGAFLVHEKR